MGTAPNFYDSTKLINDAFNVEANSINTSTVSSSINPIYTTNSSFVNPSDVYVYDAPNWVGDLNDLFKFAEGQDIYNDNVEDTKTLFINFKTPIASNILGVYATNGTFSNTRLTILVGTNEFIIVDEVDDNTPKQELTINMPDIIGFSAIILEFHTTNTITLGSIAVTKNIFTSSVIRGTKPNGEYANVNTNILGNLLVSLDEQKDAFGRLKVAEPYTIFDSSLTTEDSLTLFWSILKNGTGNNVYNKLQSHNLLTTSATNDYVVSQTYQRFKYQPAKSHEFFITGRWNTEVGQRKRAGLVDYDNIGLTTITNIPQNGIFFENDRGNLSWNIVNNGIITEKVTQDQWNIDQCNGTGKSKFIFNTNSTNIITCQLEWLGVGVVLVGFAIGAGSVIYCHAFEHASIDGIINVYMRTANLPVAYEITSLSGAGTMKQICSSVISGGGFNPRGVSQSVQNNATVAIATGINELVIGIRLKEDSFEFSVLIENISMLVTSGADSAWKLVINPTYSSTVTWVNKPLSQIEYAVNNNNIYTDGSGVVIESGTFSTTTNTLTKNIESSLRIGKSLTSVRDEIWLIVKPFTNNETYIGTINYRELI